MTKIQRNKLSHTKSHKTPRYLQCLRPSLAVIIYFFVLFILVSSSAYAVTYISQSYQSSGKLATGALVSLVENTSDQVAAANSNSVDNLLGVVINSNNSIVSISDNGGNQSQIATSGTLDVLVSDINGSITKGSQITASPLSGVGMKATTNTRVIGIAQGKMTTDNSQQESYTDKAGEKHSVRIGQVPVLVNVSYFFKEPDKTIIPAAIQNVANAVAGKPVSTLPILASVAIFIITLVVVVSIIYSMVNSSIISVGRNPMSQSAIYRDIVQLSALVLAILAVGMISIYLVLTRL